MPPQILSESDSDGDVIPAKSTRKAAPVDEEDDIEEDVEEEEDEEAGEDEEEFVVEAIKDHKYEGKQLFLQVKWKGYEKKSDMTWEPEENCEGAREILMEYYAKIGGRPELRASSASKRGRQSVGGTPASAAPKNNKRARISVGKAVGGKGSSMGAGQGVEDVSPEPSDDKWKPPAKGSWEDEITAIDTIEKTNKGLICYVQWNNGRKTQHDIKIVYSRCPQKMLSFYEQHLVFKESGSL